MTIVFLPGILIGKDCFAPTEKIFIDAGYKTYIHSFPGFDGRARLSNDTPTPEEYADDLYLKVNGLGKLHLYAHCSGCTPAIMFSIKYPGLVASLTLISYWHGTKEWESRLAIIDEGVEAYALNRIGKLIGSDNSGTISRVVGWIKSAITDFEGFFQMARSINKYSAKELLPLIKAPVQFIIGSRDKITLPEAQIAVAKKYTDSITIIPEGSHCMFFEDPITPASETI